MSVSTVCDLCVGTKHGMCVNGTCFCFTGFLGIACQDPVTTPPTKLISEINVASIIASVFGGALFTLIVGLIVFFVWKRRSKKKSFNFSASNSTTATVPSSEPVVAPALYDISLSHRAFSLTSARTESYHLYDELK